MILADDGTIEDDIQFFAATIESKAKLAYDDVSDWLENNGSWQPDSETVARQIKLLQEVCLRRSEWRKTTRWCSKTARIIALCWAKRRSAGYRCRTAPHR